jgi:hypothetical protein
LRKVYAALLLGSFALSFSACSNGTAVPAGAPPAVAPAAVAATPTSSPDGKRHRRKPHLTDVLGIDFQFSASSVAVGSPVTLLVTLTNYYTVALMNMGFGDALPHAPPAGTMRITVPPTASSTCGGTFKAVKNAVAFSDLPFALAPGASCHMSVTVIPDSAGTYAEDGTQYSIVPPKGFIMRENVSTASVIATMPATKRLYVPDGPTNRILVFSNTATGGTPPTWVITGSTTALSYPRLVATDPANGDIYVANKPVTGTEFVTVYPASIFTAFPQGGTIDAAPTRNFTVPAFADTLSGIQGMAVDSAHELVAAFSDTSQSSADGVYWFAATADGAASPLFWADPPGVGWNTVTADVPDNRVFLGDSEGHEIEVYSNQQGIPTSSSATVCQWKPAPLGSTNYFQIAYGGNSRSLVISSRWAPPNSKLWGEIQNVDPCTTPVAEFEDINSAIAGGGATELTEGAPIAVDYSLGRVSETAFPFGYQTPKANLTPHILSWPAFGPSGNVAPAYDLTGNCASCSGSMSYDYQPDLFAYGP